MNNVHWKINVLHIDREQARVAKENAHYTRVIKTEIIGIILLASAFVAFELIF